MKLHFDVVIVGAGPAGLCAARAAVGSGARVAVLDDNPRAGGQVWRQGPRYAPSNQLTDVLGSLQRASNLTLFASARVIAPLGVRDLLVESAATGGVQIGFERLILVTGARERLLPFTGWTLPGVTGAGGLQALIKGGVPVRGQRIVIAGSGPLLIAALATAREAGAEVVAVVEQAPWAAVARFATALAATPSKLWQAARLTRGMAGLRYWTGSVVRAALGDGRVEQVRIRRGEREIVLACERVACGYGLVPNVTLAQALGCQIDAGGAIVVDDGQRTSVEGIYAAGECTGIGGMELARAEGAIAGLCAAGELQQGQQTQYSEHMQHPNHIQHPNLIQHPNHMPQMQDVQHTQHMRQWQRERDRWRRFARHVGTAFELTDAARTLPPDETLLCRCEDVSCGEVRAFPNWREAKLHTRCGMGACQGRICGTAAHVYFGWQAAPPRPPFSPASIATLMEAGQSYRDECAPRSQGEPA
jgi:NADPH-dependent 2,4-dienoyl-CoA reductase/sulfur reductase-like enzyme